MLQPIDTGFSLKLSQRLLRGYWKPAKSRISRKGILKCLSYSIHPQPLFPAYRVPRQSTEFSSTFLSHLQDIGNRQELAAIFRDQLVFSRTHSLYWDKYKSTQCCYYTGVAFILHVTLSLFISHSLSLFSTHEK